MQEKLIFIVVIPANAGIQTEKPRNRDDAARGRHELNLRFREDDDIVRSVVTGDYICPISSGISKNVGWR